MINITQKGELARKLFFDGYSCSQAVAGAFAHEIGLPLEKVLCMAQPFGGGMGRLREVCGAFSGMMFVIGSLYGDAEPNSDNKAKVYTVVQLLSERFREVHGSVVCREILGYMKGRETDPEHPSERNAEFYKKRPCAYVVATAASILEEYIRE